MRAASKQRELDERKALPDSDSSESRRTCRLVNRLIPEVRRTVRGVDFRRTLDEERTP